jgi:hypothetical protein
VGPIFVVLAPPFFELNIGGYAEIDNLDARKAKVKADFDSFLLGRAKNILPVISALCEGHEDAPSQFGHIQEQR